MVKLKKRVICKEELKKYERRQVFESTPSAEEWL